MRSLARDREPNEPASQPVGHDGTAGGGGDFRGKLSFSTVDVPLRDRINGAKESQRQRERD